MGVKLFLLANAALIPAAAFAQSVGKPASDSDAALSGEIVVTAQKREERLQDVPVPVAVMNAQELAKTGQVRLQEYFSNVPGLNVSPSGTTGNQQMLVIRGISSGGSTNSTVGITIDDVPFGSNFSFAGNITPDFDPSDLARVEVLRGPQGTLYGAASMGGLLKFVTADPSTKLLSGNVQADVNSVHNGDQLGYGLRGSINAPLSETLAVRVSGFTRRDAGYIDNPVQNKDGVNKADYYGGRLSAIWKPSDTFRLKLSALYQHSKGDSISEVDILPGLTDLQQNANVGCCGWQRELQAYSATATMELGTIELTSLTGYNVSDFRNSLDYTYLLGAAFGAPSVRYQMHGKTNKFTQELRANIPLGETFDWLVAAFFQREKTRFVVSIPTVGLTTGLPIPGASIADIDLPHRFGEFALFTDLTINLSERFNIQLGARESFIKQTGRTQTIRGPLFGGGTTIVPPVTTKPNVFTFMITPQFKVSPDLMLYGRVASGYRQGEPNTPLPGLVYPLASSPDRTVNYEVGAKGDLVPDLLSFDASLYYIDWKDIQLKVRIPGTAIGYTDNGGRAKSVGAELTLVAKPTDGLTLRGWYSYNEAELTENFPATATVFGVKGTRLPYSARHTANVSVDQSFPLGDKITANIGGQLSYVGQRLGTFQATAVRAVYPSYTKFDLRAGLKYQDWSASFYVNNVTDKRGVIGGGIGSFPPYGFYYIQPRTIGMSLSKDF